jgi:ArsR family transcriptional regulator
LEKALETGQPHISRHLAYLKHAGWVQPRRERTWMFYALRGDLGELAAATLHALQREWERTPLFRADQERLDRLIQRGSCHSTSASGNQPVTKEVTSD